MVSDSQMFGWCRILRWCSQARCAARCRILRFSDGVGFSDSQMVSDSQNLKWCRILRWCPDTTLSDSQILRWYAILRFSDGIGFSDGTRSTVQSLKHDAQHGVGFSDPQMVSHSAVRPLGHEEHHGVGFSEKCNFQIHPYWNHIAEPMERYVSRKSLLAISKNHDLISCGATLGILWRDAWYVVV